MKTSSCVMVEQERRAFPAVAIDAVIARSKNLDRSLVRGKRSAALVLKHGRSKGERTKSKGELHSRDNITKNCFVVWREMCRSFNEVGMLVPSSQALAKAMVRPMKERTRPLRILEVGPGTGPMTREILAQMTKEDSLVVCEINKRFLTQLEHNLLRNQHYQQHRSRVSFHCGPVQELALNHKGSSEFDIIVSSLPFLRFSPELVDELLNIYHEMLADDGVLSVLEYVGLRHLIKLVNDTAGRKRMQKVDRVLRRWTEYAKYHGSVRRSVTVMNVPPALSVQYSFGQREAEKQVA